MLPESRFREVKAFYTYKNRFALDPKCACPLGAFAAKKKKASQECFPRAGLGRSQGFASTRTTLWECSPTEACERCWR
eukprot:429481-Amphidinium_carterae.1